MRELWLKVASVSGTKALTLVMGLATLVATTRLLGPDGRGTVAAITTWVGLFSTLSYLSLGQVAVHRAALAKGKAWLGSTLGSLLLMAGLLTIACWGVAVLAAVWTHGDAFRHLPSALLMLGFMSLPLLIWEQYATSLLMASDQLHIYNRAQLMGRAFGVLLLLGLLALGWGVPGVLVANMVGQAIVALIGLRCLLVSAETPIRPDWATIYALLAGGLRLHLNAVGTFLFTSVNVLILNHYGTTAETGHYQLATQLITMLLVVPQAASMALYSKVAKDGPDAAWPDYRRMLATLLGGLVVLIALGAALAPWAIPLVAGPAFAPAVPIFQLQLLALLGMAVSLLMSPQWIGRGLFWQASVISLAVGLVNLAANFLLVPTFGMYGAAWAMLISYSLALMTNMGLAMWIDRRLQACAA